MDIRFWGTRGSLAKPGRITLRHGGNTSCVEVRGDDGTLIVLDCGTGAHGLGQALLSAGLRCDGHLMITHTHWDHIQGFPFFAPLFVPGNTWDIYAPGALGRQLERTLAGQMEYNYFPVTLAQLAATIRFHDIAEGEFAIGEMRVATQYLNHPALTHHDPLRDDEAVDRVVEMCRRRASAAGSGLEVFAAAEGQELRLIERDNKTPVAARAPEPARKVGPHTILVADDDPTIVRLLTLALEQDGFRVVTASDGEAALRLARLEHPDLILLDWQMPNADGMEVTRRLRNEPDPALRDVPVVLITAQSGPENTAAGFAAGVTDYLTKPFRPAHVRARVQAWLLRRPAEAPRDT